MAFTKLFKRLIQENPQMFKRVVTSTPTPVDVSANGMAKKYSRGSIRTSYGSSGLLTGSRLNKKTLLGE